MNNKVILKDRNFPFPLCLTFFTLCFSSLAGVILVHGMNVELKNKSIITSEFYVSKILPIGVLTAGTIVLGMASYLFLTVSFIQMLKAFTPVMTLFFLVIFRLDTPKMKQVYFVLLICFGTAVAGSGELNFHFTGAMCMISAQICEALKLVFTQKVLKTDKTETDKSQSKVKFSVFESLYYISPACTICVFFAALFIEIPMLFSDENNAIEIFFENLHVFCFSGVLAVSTNLMNWYVIQISDALMLKLVATARNALLVLFNAMFLGEVVTSIQFLGYFLSLAGFIGYNYVKVTSNKQATVPALEQSRSKKNFSGAV